MLEDERGNENRGRLMKSGSIATMLGVCDTTVRKFIRKYGLPAFRNNMHGGHFYAYENDIIRWCERTGRNYRKLSAPFDESYFHKKDRRWTDCSDSEAIPALENNTVGISNPCDKEIDNEEELELLSNYVDAMNDRDILLDALVRCDEHVKSLFFNGEASYKVMHVCEIAREAFSELK